MHLYQIQCSHPDYKLLFILCSLSFPSFFCSLFLCATNPKFEYLSLSFPIPLFAQKQHHHLIGETVAGILPLIDQEEDDYINQLEPLVSSLGEEWMLKQENRTIKLLLACIYSDILRIYAPEQPYEDDQALTLIFQIMISALDGVQHPDEENYHYHFRVLESLSTVQSYILMNDLQNDSLLLSLTKTLFKVTKTKTAKSALQHITDILCGIIADIQSIPEPFLQFLLDRLIEPYRTNNPTEYDLSATVIRRCGTEHLSTAISEYISGTISNFDDLLLNDPSSSSTTNPTHSRDDKKELDDDDDTERGGDGRGIGTVSASEAAKRLKKEKALLRQQKKVVDDARKNYKQKLCIVTELASISVEFVEPQVLRLEECLQNEELEIRRLFVDMFASLFTQSCPALSSEGSWSPIFRVFLKRFDDISPEIRLFMAQLIGSLFQTQLPFKKEIQEFCIKRVEDLEEEIRATVIQQVSNATIQHSSNTPTSLLPLHLFNKMQMRTLDKKESVRFTAIEWLSKMFAAHCRPYWRNNMSLPPEMRALLPIPKKLVSILPSVDLKTKLQIESIFDREIIGNDFFKSSVSRLSQNSNLTQNSNSNLTLNSSQLDSDEVADHIMQRINVILGVMALLRDEHRLQFQEYFLRKKYRLHSVVNKVLSTYNEIRMAKSSRSSQSQSQSQSGNFDEEEEEDGRSSSSRRNLNALKTAYQIAYSNFDHRFPLYGEQRQLRRMERIQKKKGSGSPQRMKALKSSSSTKQRPHYYLKQLVENPNMKIRNYLQSLCSPTISLRSMYIATQNLLSFVNAATKSTKSTKPGGKAMTTSEANKLREFTKSLCTRLRNTLFSYDAVPLLLVKLVEIMEHQNCQPRALLKSGIHILECLCEEIPTLFEHDQCLPQLIKLYYSPSTTSPENKEIARNLSFVALRILSRSIQQTSFGEEGPSPQWISDLTQKAKSNTNHKEAQLATECLIRCSGKYSTNIKSLCNETSKELDITEQYLPTLLSTLSMIAKLSPNVFIGRAQHIVTFILETLLPFNPHSKNGNDGIYAENQFDENNENRNRKNKSRKKLKEKQSQHNMTPLLLTSKQCGIRILVNYLLSIADLPADQLGMASVTVGISPIKSSLSSKRKSKRTSPRMNRNRNRKRSGIDLGGRDSDEVMDDVDDDEDEDVDIDLVHQNEVQLVEDPDPFSKDAPIMRDPISPEIECDRIIDALFDLIRKYGRIDPQEYQHELRPEHRKTPRKYGDSKSKTNSKSNENKNDNDNDDDEDRISEDEMSVVNMAVDALLDIICQSRYRKLFGLPRMYEIGLLIHHRESKIRQHTLLAFWDRLKDQKLPSHFSCVFPLVATVPNRTLREMYKDALAKYFQRMRLQIKIRTATSTNALTPVQISRLPEYVLFYVVHLLVNHPDFDEQTAKEEWRRSGNKYEYKGMVTSSELQGRRRQNTESTENKDNEKVSQSATSDALSGGSGDNTGNGTGTEQNNVNDKEEENERNGVNLNAEKAEKSKMKKKRNSKGQSVKEYFGAIFDFYFDALLRGDEKADQFPLIHRVITKIDECTDVYHPMSKSHRFLARIALSRFKPLYQGKQYNDFPGKIPVPKVIFREKGGRKNDGGSGYDSGRAERTSPRRTDARKSSRSNKLRSKSNRESSRSRKNRHFGPNLVDSSLFQTTTSDSTLLTTSRRQKKGIFSSSEILKAKKKGDPAPSAVAAAKEKGDKKEEEEEQGVEEVVSDHPSDNDVVDDMPGFDLSAMRRNLDESLIDRTDTVNGNGDGKVTDKEDGGKGMSSGSGAEADDETNSALSPKRKGRTKRDKTKTKTGGRKRKRKEMLEGGKKKKKADGDAQEDAEPPKKSRKTATRS